MAASSGRKQTPNFFDDGLDPIKAATASPKKQAGNKPEPLKEPSGDRTIEPQNRAAIDRTGGKKRKVGYYFKPHNIDRLEKIYLETQLKGLWKGKPSEFMEAILEFGLNDLESENSIILKQLEG